MKKILLGLSGLTILTIIIAGCTPVPTPDVEVTGFTAIGNYVDSSYAFTIDTVFVHFDDTRLVVKNYVNVKVDRAYCEVYQVVDANSANDIFIRRDDILGFSTQNISEDSTGQYEVTIKGLMLNVKAEAESLWVDKDIQSYRLDLHFAGEDAYGKHKRFDVYRSTGLARGGAVKK